MTRWEYMVLSMWAENLADLEKRIGNLGSQGWEVISVIPSPHTHTVYFKRPAGQVVGAINR